MNHLEILELFETSLRNFKINKIFQSNALCAKDFLIIQKVLKLEFWYLFIILESFRDFSIVSENWESIRNFLKSLELLWNFHNFLRNLMESQKFSFRLFCSLVFLNHSLLVRIQLLQKIMKVLYLHCWWTCITTPSFQRNVLPFLSTFSKEFRNKSHGKKIVMFHSRMVYSIKMCLN